MVQTRAQQVMVKVQYSGMVEDLTWCRKVVQHFYLVQLPSLVVSTLQHLEWWCWAYNVWSRLTVRKTVFQGSSGILLMILWRHFLY